MEKGKPHYLLKAIQAQMTSVSAMNLTLSAKQGIRQVGMTDTDALQVIAGLNARDFVKSMTTHADHRVWQDVYTGQWDGVPLYIKFQQAGSYFVQGADRMNMSKWHGAKCPICGVGTLADGERESVIDYRGRTYREVLRGAFCDHCADGIVEHDPAGEAKFIEFRNAVDAELGSDLARIRKRLKLTQAEAARLTGGGKNAFSRYERGEARPLAAVINLFRLLDKHPELLNELRAKAA